MVIPPPPRKLKPTQSTLDALYAQANRCFEQQNFAALFEIAQELKKLFPKVALGFKASGTALYFLNEKRRALADMKKAVLLDSKDFESLSNLGQCLNETAINENELIEAKKYLKQALQFNAKNAIILNNLAINSMFLKNFDEALNYIEKSLKINPEYILAQLNLARVYLENKDPIHLEIVLKKLVEQENKMNVEERILFYLLQSDIYLENKEWNKAEVLILQTIEWNPSNEKAHRYLGKLSYLLGKKYAMFLAYEKAYQLNALNVENLCNYVFSLKEIGQGQKACDLILNSFKKYPHHPLIQEEVLKTLVYAYQSTPEWVGKIVNQIKKSRIKKQKNIFTHFQPKTNPKRLKIGFVSANLNEHAVSFFMFNILKEFQNKNFDLYAYILKENKDKTSELFKTLFHKWQNIEDLSDECAAQLIYKDGVHILFDLHGYTKDSRLNIFSFKPAPVQISWMGFFGTTAIAEMDYFLADTFTALPSITKQFTERVYLLPDVWECYFPATNLKMVSDSPVLKNGFLTFGSFANTNKASEKTLELWASVLKALPHARFFYFRDSFNEKALVLDYLKRFQNLGVNLNQIILVGMRTIEDYVDAFAQVDVILDTFPVSGMTTTAEALYMGIPTLSFAGNLMASRLSALCMHSIGEDHWIVTNEKDYVNSAVSLYETIMRNPKKLNELRFSLREKMLNSPLCDSKRFAHNFEIMLWDVWQNFLNQKNPR